MYIDFYRQTEIETRERQMHSQKFAVKKMGTPDVLIDTRLNTSVWARRKKNVPNCIQLFRKHNEDEDSPNKFYTFVTYVLYF